MEWYWTAVLAMGIGFCAGIVSALAGVGGAVLTTPGIRALGAPPLVAVGSTVPAIIPSAIVGSIRYSRAGLVNWRVAIWVGVTGMASAFAGAWAADLIGGNWLMVVTAMLVLYGSASLLRPRHPVPAPASGELRSAGAAVATDLPVVAGASLAVLIAVGIGAGSVAGLLGVGGGLVLVPAFTVILRMGVKETVATSLVAVALMSISSLVGHVMAGHVDWTYALPLMIGVIPGAQVGSKIALRLPDHTMRVLCGVLLGVIGLVYLITELMTAL